MRLWRSLIHCPQPRRTDSGESPCWYVYTLSITSRACSSLGRWADAAEIGKKALSVAEQNSDNSLITFASWNLSINYGWAVDIVRAIEYAELAIEKAQTHAKYFSIIFTKSN
jgi:hypothetical protein